MKLVKAEIITIGDEILYGHIVDTNSQWISNELDNIGVKTVRKSTISDQEQDILSALAEATSRADIILITGGLGPTNDDLTKPTLTKYFDTHLELNEQALLDVKWIFEKVGRELTETNKQQAFLPINCKVVRNRAGTAPGMWFNENDRVYISMPGVPHEMKIMMTEEVLPKIRDVFNTPTIYHKMVKTIGIGESWLSDKIKIWEEQLPVHIKLAYLPGLGEVKLRLTAIGNDQKKLQTEVNEQLQLLNQYVEKYTYGYDQDTLSLVIGRLLKAQGLTIATAESCTGGRVAQEITSIPGSSEYFIGSVVAYSNRVKEELLQVNPLTLSNYGAVSEQTVMEMAIGVRKQLQSDIGIATSGIAGPGGGTQDKPVGTIWIACSGPKNTVAKKLSLYKDRLTNIRYTTNALLNLVRQRLVEMDGEKP